MNEKPRIHNAQEAACPAGFENENNTPDMRERALALARMGFHVFPVVVNGKKPAVVNWQERATSDLEKVRRMWTAATGEAEAFNIGIATGRPLPSGDTLFVVDLDTDAEHTVKDRTKALGAAVPDLPLSVSAWTPGKAGNRGGHIYLACPAGEEVSNSVKKIAEGVDVRGLGGYVVGPGSIIDGREYEWTRGASPSARAIAPAPRALLDLCKARPATERGDGARTSPPPCCELDTPRAIEHARAWLQDVAPGAKQGEGGRGATTHVIQRLGDFGLSADGVFNLLSEDGGWNDTKADPPWAIDADDSDDFRRLIDDLWSSHREKPAGCDFAYAAAEVFEAVEIAEGPDGTAPSGGWPLSSIDDCEAALSASEENPLIEGLLDKGAVSAWYGASNVGKSFLLAGVGYAVATGADWAGRRVVRGAVLYVAYEGGRRFKRRLAALKAHFGGAPGLPLYLAAPRKGSIYAKAAQAALLATVAAVEKHSGQKIGLIVFDTLSAARAGGGKVENSNDDMDEVAGILRQIAEDTGAHVAVVHHAGKTENKGMRGGYALECAFDTVIEVGPGVIKNPKQREYEKAKDIAFDLKTVLLPVDGEAVESKVAIVTAGAGRIKILTAEEEWALACFDDVAAADQLGRTVATDRDWSSRMRDVAQEEHTQGARAKAPSGSTLLRLRRELHIGGHVERIDGGKVRRVC